MPKPALILLALDKSSVLKLMERALRAVTYETAIANDTKSLGRLMQETSPALLLISEEFDGHRGVDIAAELLERFPTLPFLIYTEKAQPELLKEILRIGVSGFLTPPLRTDDIVDVVESTLSHAHRVGDWLRREVKRTTSSLKKQAQITEAERDRLETVFNHIHDSVMILDQEYNVILLNPAMARSFGLNPKTSIGKLALDIIEQPDLRALLSRHGDVDPLQFHEISFPDGRAGSAQLTPIPDVGYAITMQDVTYLKEMDRMRSEFVHTVSHDLRSPLTSIIGYAELIERAGTLNENQQDFLARIHDSIQHITALINDLLDLGSVEAGMDTRREYVQLEVILRYTLDMLQGQIKAKRLKVQTDIAPSLPAMRANPVRLRQVLDNVVGNAIKYSNSGGEVTISIKAEDNQLILQVTDNGPGIAAGDQPHIFDKFYRGANTKEEGSGLGLAIVKSIVDAHQGRIWVESTAGKGSSFFIVLPVSEVLATTKK